MSKNPFHSLAKFYEKSVEKSDKLGFAETYKKSTEILFNRIKSELNLDLHFEDINYLDGYFLFGYGTNSVVHFHIKEMPGWLGGIWWSPIATKETENKKKPTYETNKIYCEMFFQYEEEIDKFKPSASTFGNNFEFYFEEGYSNSGFLNMCWDIRFIINEPYLAFYKDMHYTNFNHEYVSREKAKRFWNKHWKEKARTKEIDRTNTKAMFETVKYIIDPMVKDNDAFILDEGENISPRYEIFIRNVKLSDGKPLVEEEGCYSLFGLWEYPDKKADEKLWKKTEKECAKREGYKFFYENPFHDSCIIRNTKAFNKIKNEAIKEGSLLYGKLADGTIYEGTVKSRWDD